MADVIYKKGQSANLNETNVPVEDGQILVTEDNGEMFVDGANGRVKITDINKQDKFLQVNNTDTNILTHTDNYKPLIIDGMDYDSGAAARLTIGDGISLLAAGANSNGIDIRASECSVGVTIDGGNFQDLYINNLHEPSNDYDAVTKKYMEDAIAKASLGNNDDIDLSNYATKEELNLKPGLKIKDGEIFNDYENNKAIDKSTAIGMDNIAGTKAFTVTTVLENGFVLSSVENLISEKSYKYSIKASSGFEFNIGNIVTINTSNNQIMVDKMPTIDLTGTIYLFTLDDTSIGDTFINAWEASNYSDSAAHLAVSVEGRHNIGISTGAHAEGYENKALGYFSHAEGRDTTAFGSQSHSEGRSTKALGNAAHAEGNTTVAKGDQGAHAEGSKTNALGNSAHAEGANTYAHSAYCHAEGIGTQAGTENVSAGATSNAAHAEGFQTIAKGSYSHAEGELTIAEAQSSHAEGVNTKATSLASHVEGNYTEASGPRSHAEGSRTFATNNATHTEGDMTIATGNAAHAEGLGKSIYPTDTYKNYTVTASYTQMEIPISVCGQEFVKHLETALSITIESVGTSVSTDKYFLIEINNKHYRCTDIVYALQYDENSYDKLIFFFNETIDTAENYTLGRMILTTGALATATHAEGYLTMAKGDYSHTEGLETVTTGQGAHAEGGSTSATAVYAHAEGGSTTASGWGAHAEGKGCIASANYAHAEGITSKAKGEASHAENWNTNAIGAGSHAEGRDTFAKGAYSHAEGEGCATGEDAKRAHAEGSYSAANGIASHAEGSVCAARGKCSHAEGSNSQTTEAAEAAHAEGYYSVASEKYSHAEGWKSNASGLASHAEGAWCTASHDYSHAEGYYTQSSAEYQHISGKYNADNPNALFIVGNGAGSSTTNRSNAFEVIDDGTEVYGTVGNDKIITENVLKDFLSKYIYVGSDDPNTLIENGTLPTDCQIYIQI